jgi:formyl-CoA transferase
MAYIISTAAKVLPLESEVVQRFPNALRVIHRDELLKDLGRVFAKRTKVEWLQMLGDADLVAGPINDMTQVFADPQITARELVVHAKHVSGGTVPLIASPMRMSATPLNVYTAPPTSGQHTREVLRSLLGMSESQIDEITGSQTA